jgi:hypothetical protein
MHAMLNFRITTASHRYPHINEDCEDLLNAELDALVQIKELGKGDIVDMGLDSGSKFHNLIFGKFCIGPKCTICQVSIRECEHDINR